MTVWFRKMQAHLNDLYESRGYVVQSQAVTLFYLDVFLVVFLPLLAVLYTLALPQRAAIAVPPLAVISLLALVTLIFVWKGRFGWAGSGLAYACAVVVMAAQIPKLFGEYHTAFNGFTYIFVLPILIMALFGSLRHILPIAMILFGFNLLFFILLLPRLTQSEHILSAEIGWAASSVSLLIASVIVFLLRRLMDNALHRFELVNRSIRRFVPTETLTLLNKSSVEEVRLGENRELTMAILFVDLRDFTRLAESMTSLEAFSLVNQFFGLMGPYIRKHNGYVDNYLGDGLLALFDDPQDALVASFEMQQALDDFNVQQKKDGKIKLAMGIGMHYGFLRMGTIGETDRMVNTVISDAVNTASRLEGLTKVMGSRILLSRDFLDAMHPAPFDALRLVSIVKPRGKTQAIEVYEFYGMDAPDIRNRKNGERDRLGEAVRFFAQGKPEAAERILDEYLVRFPMDIPALYLLTQCLEARQRVQNETMFEKYGCLEGILDLIDYFYAQITADPDIAPYFRGANLNRIKGHQSKVLSHLMGATIDVDPQILISFHRHLQIPPEHFTKVADYFESSLITGGVSVEDAQVLRHKFESFRRYILPET